MKTRSWHSTCPTGYAESVVKVQGKTTTPLEQVWVWLSRKDTFAKGQIPPYRVEFFGNHDDPFFHEGSLNNHHGPFLHLPACVTVMKPNEYREMQYLYGGFVISYRLIRPTALRMWVENEENSTNVTVELHAQVRPWIKGIWEWANRLFWKNWFMRSIKHIP